jgi:DNA-binding SARP family transcriptional activator
VSREQLIEYLWPTLGPSRAQKNLYTTWFLLAQALGSKRVSECPYLFRRGETYQLNPDLVTCDTEQFEVLARRILFDQAGQEFETKNILKLEGLYENALAADLSEDLFIATKMASYRSLMVDVLLMSTRQLRELGEHDKALLCARTAYELDVKREDVYCNLMDTQFEAGQRTSAMQTYFSCKRFLADELGILPSKKTTALYQDLLLDTCR